MGCGGQPFYFPLASIGILPYICEMATVGLVLLSVFGGIFFVLLVGGMATLIVLHVRGQKSAKEHAGAMADFAEDMESLLESQRAELTSLIEGARASFSGIRQEIKASQDAQSKVLAKALKDQEAVFEAKVGNINGEILQAASVRAVQACSKLSTLAVTLQTMLVAHEVQPGADLAPEEYGPSDTIYDSQNITGRRDDAALAEEAEELAPILSQGNSE
jgi:hypothetical protein